MEFAIVNEVNRTLRTVRRIDGKGYRIGEDIRALGHLIDFMEKVIKGTPGHRLVEHRQRVVMYSHLYDSRAAYAPHLSLFFDVWSRHDIRYCPETGSGEYLCGKRDDQAVVGDDSFNRLFVEFVLAMQVEGKRTDVRRKVRNWERGAKENAKSTVKYLDHLHERYARLVVVRLDLHFRASLCASDAEAEDLHWKELQHAFRSYQALFDRDVNEESSEEALRVPLTVVASAWRRFHDNMRSNSLFEGKVGHIVCFEYSRAGGYHIHTIILFDGSKRTRDHKWLAGEIGRYWDETVTKGAGYHFNCNAQHYRRNGIGVVEYHDVEKRRNLLAAALYLAKREQFICVKPSKGFKTFSHGKLFAGRRNRLGRPRGYGSTTDVANCLVRTDEAQSCDIQNRSLSRHSASASNSGYAELAEVLC